MIQSAKKSNKTQTDYFVWGGTLVCPSLTSGEYGADIYYQETKALICVFVFADT